MKTKRDSPAEEGKGADPVTQFAPAFVGLLAVRISERLIEDGGRAAQALGIETPPRCMSTMVVLAEGSKGVSEIGRAIGISHVAAMKNVRCLKQMGLVKVGHDADDARRKPVELTQMGIKEAARVVNFIKRLQGVITDIDQEIGISAYDTLLQFERALDGRSLTERLGMEPPEGC